jgi:16S rRNA (guanine966-N2)-methyltransferase
MRIVAGTWRGRRLVAPPGSDTRPTADRARQALFDMLLHAPWAGRNAVEGAFVLDAFAGTGALGLEALSRGAAAATFMEREPAALRALRNNIAACGAEQRCTVIPGDALDPPIGQPCGLLFLDPPYRQGLITQALEHLTARGWVGPETRIVAETGRNEAAPGPVPPLAERIYGAARISIWRAADTRASPG